jgi:hypothetical protein
VRHVWGRGEEEYMRVLVGKSKGRRPFGRHLLRGEDNIKMDVN